MKDLHLIVFSLILRLKKIFNDDAYHKAYKKFDDSHYVYNTFELINK